VVASEILGTCVRGNICKENNNTTRGNPNPRVQFSIHVREGTRDGYFIFFTFLDVSFGLRRKTSEGDVSRFYFGDRDFHRWLYAILFRGRSFKQMVIHRWL